MEALKRAGVFIFATIAAVAGVVTILTYFGITSERLNIHVPFTPLPSGWLLIAAILLCLSSIVLSGYGFYKLRGTTEKRALLTNEQRTLFWNGGLVTLLLGMAQRLKTQLENLREQFPNDPDLLYPISGNVPDVIKEFKHKQLLEFMSCYRMHLQQIEGYDRQFPSALAARGFPCNDGSLDVLRMIQDHIEVLSYRRNELIAKTGEAEAL